MASREVIDTTSNSGVNYTSAGHGASQTNKGIKLSAPRVSTGLAFNGHGVEIWPDKAVWDTVSNVFLFPGRDYNPGDVNRK